MKRNKFLTILVGVIALVGIGQVTAGIPKSRAVNAPAAITNNQTTPDGITVQYEESSPAEEERNLKQEFRGINLTQQQLEQVKQLRRQLKAELKQVIIPNLAQVLMLTVLPKQQAEQKLGDLLGKPLTAYGEGLSKVLTPAQLKVWQKNAENFASQRN